MLYATITAAAGGCPSNLVALQREVVLRCRQPASPRAWIGNGRGSRCAGKPQAGPLSVSSGCLAAAQAQLRASATGGDALSRCHGEPTRPSGPVAGGAAAALAAALAAAALVWLPPASLAEENTPVIAAENPVAQLAGLGSFLNREEADPIDPFTLYGGVFKKYVIEVLQGEDVISRKRGFTVTTCVSTIAANDETPAFNSLPLGERVFNSGPYLCIKRESTDLAEACSSSCSTACERQIQNYDSSIIEKSGFGMTDKTKAKVVKSGTRQCNYECNKQGRSSTFAIPTRNFN